MKKKKKLQEFSMKIQDEDIFGLIVRIPKNISLAYFSMQKDLWIYNTEAIFRLQNSNIWKFFYKRNKIIFYIQFGFFLHDGRRHWLVIYWHA